MVRNLPRSGCLAVVCCLHSYRVGKEFREFVNAPTQILGTFQHFGIVGK